jgi:hypothetical protein
MNILLAILGALISGGVAGGAAFFVSKRAKEKGGIDEEISELRQDLDRALSRAARIQQAQEQQAASGQAH